MFSIFFTAPKLPFPLTPAGAKPVGSGQLVHPKKKEAQLHKQHRHSLSSDQTQRPPAHRTG